MTARSGTIVLFNRVIYFHLGWNDAEETCAGGLSRLFPIPRPEPLYCPITTAAAETRFASLEWILFGRSSPTCGISLLWIRVICSMLSSYLRMLFDRTAADEACWQIGFIWNRFSSWKSFSCDINQDMSDCFPSLRTQFFIVFASFWACWLVSAWMLLMHWRTQNTKARHAPFYLKSGTFRRVSDPTNHSLLGTAQHTYLIYSFIILHTLSLL